MMVLIKTVSKTNSPLFCLSVIYIQKSLKPLFFKEWIISGIFFVNDIIDKNGKIP